MTKHNGKNERIKRTYFAYLKEANGRDEATIDGVAKALARFEDSTGRKDFGKLHREQIIAFKRKLTDSPNARTGERLSKATMVSTMRHCKDFFVWLKREPGFHNRIAYSDADYFNLSAKDVTISRARRDKAVPTLDQVHHVLATMPAGSVVERRNRALVAFTAMTGARVGALASFRLRHVDVDKSFVDQDARTVATKFAKTFRTFFVPIGGEAEAIFAEWVRELTTDLLWGLDDPLFPATEMGIDEAGGFRPAGLLRTGWRTTQPINAIFKRAFEAAGLLYFNPHSFRDMLVHHGMLLGLGPEAMKAWSQNLGHAGVLTTFTSYGTVPTHKQGELIRAAGPNLNASMDAEALIAAFRSLVGKAA